MKLLMALTAVLIATACSVAPSRTDRNTIDRRMAERPLVIAGGKTVRLPMVGDQALPAENDLLVIRAAAFLVRPSDNNPGQRVLRWTFGFESKGLRDFDHVLVEEVYPSTTEVTYVKDSAPALKNGYWMQTGDAIAVSPTTVPWLFADSSATFVFKFTIKPKGQAPVVLYQPAFFAKEAKAVFLPRGER